MIQHSPIEHFSDSSQREKWRKKLERDRKEKEAREHKDRLEVRCDHTLSNWMSLQPYCRKTKCRRNLNMRRKRRRLGNMRKNSRCVTIPISSDEHHSDSIVEGKEAKGS